MTPEQRIILSMREAMEAEAAKPPLEPQPLERRFYPGGVMTIWENTDKRFHATYAIDPKPTLVIDNTGGPDAA